MRKRVVEAVGRARTEGRAVRLLFVCLGNICRSPAAQGIVESIARERGMAGQVECDSAGFYGGHAGSLPDSRMRAAASRRGYRLDHRARRIREADFDRFDLLIGMDRQNDDDLRRLAPTIEDENKIIGMADFALSYPEATYVPDPYYEGAEGFELVLDLLQDAAGHLLDTISDAEAENA